MYLVRVQVSALRRDREADLILPPHRSWMPRSAILRDCTPVYRLSTLHTPLHPSVPQLAFCIKVNIVLEAAWRAGTASTLRDIPPE